MTIVAGKPVSTAAGRPAGIVVLGRPQLAQAVALLAEGMRDNPLHVAVFGRDPVRRQRRLQRVLSILLARVHAHGTLYGVAVEGRLVAVLGAMEPGRCRPRSREIPRLALALGSRQWPTVSWRLRRWLRAWQARDPDAAHVHLGPLAVRPAWRRRGIARRLMRHALRQADEGGWPAWLETDLPSNAAFYESLGFELVERCEILGTSNWFMRRPPQGS